MSIRFRLGARYRKVTAKQCHPAFGGTPGGSPRPACTAETRRRRVGLAFQSQRPVSGSVGRRSGSGRQRSLTNPTWSPGFGFTWEFAAGAYPENPPKRPIKGLTRIRTKGAAIATAASTARQSTAKMMLFLQDMAPLISLSAAVYLDIYTIIEQRPAALTLSECAHPLAKR